MFEEGKQIAAHFAITFSQPPTISVGWRQHHNRIEFVIQPTQISPACAFGECLASLPQHNRAEQQALHTRSKDRISGLNGESAYALSSANLRGLCGPDHA